MRPAIIWFRRNLRLRDNAALEAAVSSGQPVIPVYISDEREQGSASRWWLHHSLASLAASIEAQSGRLVIRQGNPAEVLTALLAETEADSLYFAHRYEPECRSDEETVNAAIGDRVDIHGFDDSLLNHPAIVMTQSGTSYRVFTPYWRAATSLGEPPAPLAQPGDYWFGETPTSSMELDDLDLLPTGVDWTGGLDASWEPGETGALNRLDTALETVGEYHRYRNIPGIDGTSRLSPHLHFGEISVRQVWHSMRGAESRGVTTQGIEALLRQLYWRDFSTYLLYHFPQLPERPLRPEFENFPWSNDAALLTAWQHGRTGFPIVDAGMRQLWHTGWMHNRTRMIVASFLVKDLLIPWQRGAEWFLDTLVDADLANNSASWQWVAGCGTDAAPYFRVFNPSRQAEKFDPKGDYVRQWVPELLTRDYPAPLVDHRLARERALEAYKLARSTR